MNVKEIQVFARNRGIKPGRLNKINLVRLIQREEGNFDCFATAYDGVCDQTNCYWREDCLKLAVKQSHKIV